jgi:nucleoside phosphorylase
MEYIDIVLVVPLEIELQEVLSVFPLKQDLTTPAMFRGIVDLGDTEISALVVHQESMGKTAAARALRSITKEYKCGLAVSIGIAGSLSSDANLLDVCYSGELIDVGENSRVSDGSSGSLNIDFSPTFYSTEKSLTQAINYSRIIPNIKCLHEKWGIEQLEFAKTLLTEAGIASNDKNFPKRAPCSLNGTIVCVPNVVKSEAYKKRLSEVQRKILAIEMEAAGVFEAAKEVDSNIECIVIRGISDNSDKNKASLEDSTNGAFRKIAARNAATFLKLQLSNPHFVDFVKQKRSPKRVAVEVDQSAAEPVHLAKKLAEQISTKLGELSPEYKLVPKGYRLPLPRLQKPLEVSDPDSEADTEQPFAIDLVRQQSDFLFVLPRTYPDSCLGHVLADSLVTCEFDGKQVLPFVIDGSQIRPPRHGFQSQHPDFDFEKLCSSQEVRLIFIVENPGLQSKSKSKFLLAEIAKFPGAQFIYLTREGSSSFDVNSFATEKNLQTFNVGEISFTEIAHFVQKNFEIAGKEADVIALRIRDTLRRFRLAVHPTYFAGVAKELLNALLVANRRSELVQLAVDGYLTFLVADDPSEIRLSRSTRKRFLQKLAIEIHLNKKTFKESDVVMLAEEFAKEFDFPIKPIVFVADFFDKAILGYQDSRVVFLLPFIEHYLIATYLVGAETDALRYFDLEDDNFDIATFDLYAEIGASPKLVDVILSRLQESSAELSKINGTDEILYSNSIRPRLIAQPNLIGNTQRRIKEILSDNDDDGRAQKQFILDISDKAQEQAIEERRKTSKKMKGVDIDSFSRIDRRFFVGVVLLGLGSETLSATVKSSLSKEVLKLGAALVEKWTRANSSIDFEMLRKKMEDDGFAKRFEKHGVTSDASGDMLDDLIGLLEIAFVSHPLRRVLEALCEQARSKVLMTTLDRVVTENKTQELLHALWVADINTKRGKQLFEGQLKRKAVPQFLGITVATHLMSRVFWRHWDKDDRLRLLDLASEALKTIDRTIDKGKLQRLLKADEKEED